MHLFYILEGKGCVEEMALFFRSEAWAAQWQNWTAASMGLWCTLSIENIHRRLQLEMPWKCVPDFSRIGLWSENEVCPCLFMGSRPQPWASQASHPHGNLLWRAVGINGQVKWIHMTDRRVAGLCMKVRSGKFPLATARRELGIYSIRWSPLLLSHSQPPLNDYSFSWGDIGRQFIYMDSC